jgi:hypothetical protein
VYYYREPGLPDGLHIFEPKITIWVYFGRPGKENFWCISLPNGILIDVLVYIFYGHFGIFVATCVGIFLLILVYCTQKKMAILQNTRDSEIAFPTLHNFFSPRPFRKVSTKTTLFNSCQDKHQPFHLHQDALR